MKPDKKVSMKGIIDAEGYLFIKRPKILKPACCSSQLINDDIIRRCGDWCAVFGEPEKNGSKNPNYTWRLSLCKDKDLWFSELKDERE